MLELVKKLERKEDITGIEGLVWKDENGGVHVNPLPPLIKDLDKIPFPARHLMPNDKFYCPIAKHRKFTTMIAKSCGPPTTTKIFGFTLLTIFATFFA